MRDRLATCTCVTLALVLASLPASAQQREREPARDLSVVARVGGSYNALNRPSDAAGEPTLLYGTAFTGGGFVIGAGLIYQLGSGGAGDVSLGLDLLYSHMSGAGYAETADRAQRQELTLTLDALRIPLLLRLTSAADDPDGSLVLSLGVGAEVLLGLASGATLVSEGLDEPPAPLNTTPTTHIGLAAAFGAAWKTSEWAIPFEVRLTWDPMVEESTRSRFDSYVSASQPGNYQVAFDWQVLFMAGFEYNL